NYFIGNDPSKWRTNVPHYAKVRYRDVYPGIDLVYYAKDQNLEYDLVVAPGSDPNLIHLTFEGAAQMQLDANHDLIVEAPEIGLIQRKPQIYQEFGGRRSQVSGRWVLGLENQAHFRVDEYRRSQALVIDPVIDYAVRLGGSGGYFSRGVAVDATGAAYVTGNTISLDFPILSGALQPSYRGGDCGPQGRGPSCGDAFVMKLDPEGKRILYSTYLGGVGPDGGWKIAVDSQGNAVVAGNARSEDFPTTPGAFQTTGRGGTCGVYSSNLAPYPCSDVFVAKLNAQGSSLLFSTLLGSSDDDLLGGLAIHSSGAIYISGTTSGADLPTSPGTIQTSFGGQSDAFVAKLSSSGDSLIYSSYLGGTGSDESSSIAVDSSGNAFVVGGTRSTNFPTSSSAFQRSLAGNQDAFVSKINASGTTILFSTYLGGESSSDTASDVAVDVSGNSYATGQTSSTDFPVTAGAIQPSFGGEAVPTAIGDAFVVKLNPEGTALNYSTFLGGSGGDSGSNLALDSGNQIIIAGATTSLDFPVVKPIQPEKGSYDDIFDTDIFVTKLNALGSDILYSSYLGGEGRDSNASLAIDGIGCVYVVGQISSTAFPAQTMAGRPSWKAFGLADLFAAKLIDNETQTIPPAYFVPVVLSSQGLNGSFYTTELTVTNRSRQDATLQLTYTASIGEGSGLVNMILPAGRQRIIPDVIVFLRDYGLPIPTSGNQGGTLRVGFTFPGVFSYRDVAVTARTTNVVLNGRVGLAYSGIPVWKGLNDPSLLIGLRQDELDRSNVALQNMGSEAEGDVELQLTIYSGNPDAPTEHALPLVRLQPGGFRQINEILNFDGIALKSGYVRVERLSGSAPYYAYGVINDQKNSDGSFVPPVKEGTIHPIVPVIVETGSYQTEVTLVNGSTVHREFLLRYEAPAVRTPDHTVETSVALAPGQQTVIPGFVSYLRDHGLADALPPHGTYAGPLLVSFQSPGESDGVYVLARTLTSGPKGRFGVAYPGIRLDDLPRIGSWVYGLQQNEESRSNLAIAAPFSLAVNPSLFMIDLYDGDTGLKAASIEGIAFASERWMQLGSILRSYAPGTRQAYAHVRWVGGASSIYFVYATLNDGAAPGERTGDGAFLSGLP
ncbi:MAG: SBBP repeat-containing protein, partial [Acidobacteriota bacterium]